jgi:4-diphosphocytidyl-2-C-methyl-D-erythritol kinase
MSLHNVEAPAKLNLFLNVVGRRSDGYHLLESLFVFVGLADRFGCFQPVDKRDAFGAGYEFSSSIGPDNTNLVLKARDLLREASGHPDHVVIDMDKVIPVAAGLGGGSADAAATLRMLNIYWGLDWPLEKLIPLAKKLGADVPACLMGKPVIARGIGDQLSDAPTLPEYSVMLLNPRVPTATPDVFRAYAKANATIPQRQLPPLPAAWADIGALAAYLELRGNDLLPAAISVTPAISDVLAELLIAPNIAYSGLSGSGATCFGLFQNDADARKAGEHILRSHPDWWAWWPGRMYR